MGRGWACSSKQRWGRPLWARGELGRVPWPHIAECSCRPQSLWNRDLSLSRGISRKFFKKRTDLNGLGMPVHSLPSVARCLFAVLIKRSSQNVQWRWVGGKHCISQSHCLWLLSETMYSGVPSKRCTLATFSHVGCPLRLPREVFPGTVWQRAGFPSHCRVWESNERVGWGRAPPGRAVPKAFRGCWESR